MKITVLLAIAVVTGIVIGGVSTYVWLIDSNTEVGRVYFVHDITDYDDNYEGNVKAVIQAFIEGERGHVKTIKCLFPPGTKITESTAQVSKEDVVENFKKNPTLNIYSLYGNARWSGIYNFQVVRSAKNNPGYYYCELLQSAPK